MSQTELTFERMASTNGERAKRWHGDGWLDDSDPWTLADWGNAMCGEAGEAANVVKKMRRVEAMLWDQQRYPGDSSSSDTLTQVPADEVYELLRGKLAAELADVVLYADLLAQKAGIDLGEAIREKFNRVSTAQGFPERL